jgi:3-hydroxyisobutyrate dehydrogenase-like beta-hydroxyacid dehydrogenase
MRPKDKEIVFVCVGNDDDLRSVVLGDKGTLAGMSWGTILVDNTTVSANVVREFHGILAKQVSASSMRLFPAVKPVRRTER